MRLLNNWKTVIGYLAASLLGGTPMLADAVKRAVEAPTAQSVAEAVAQGLLAVGIGHRIYKNAREA